MLILWWQVTCVQACMCVCGYKVLFYFFTLKDYIYICMCSHACICMCACRWACVRVFVFTSVCICAWKSHLKKKCMLLYVRAWACAAGSELCGWSYLADPAQWGEGILAAGHTCSSYSAWWLLHNLSTTFICTFKQGICLQCMTVFCMVQWP